MASNVIRRGFFSWAAPAGGVDLTPPQVVSASGAGTSLAIVFNEALRASPAFAQFAVTANGVTKAVSAAAVVGSTLTLTVASLGAGAAIVVTYTPGGTPSARLADNARGNEVLGGTLVSYTS